MNWTGKISSYFVKNGKLSLILVIFLFFWGILSFILTPKQYNPTISAPSFQIKVNFPGASKKEILEQVTRPLENIISDIPGVEDVYSVTSHGGAAVVNANFYVGEDFDSAKINLSDKITSNLRLAPLGIPHPEILSVDPEDVPILTISLNSNVLDAIALRKFGFRLRDRLRIIPGATNINVVGGVQRELGIIVDQKKLEKYAINLGSVEEVLRKNNLFLPSGLIKKDKEYIPLEVSGLITSPEEIKNIVIISNDNIRIKLKDFATVMEKAVETEHYTRHLIKKDNSLKTFSNVVLLSVAKIKGSNISTVSDKVVEEINNLKNHFIPQNIHAEIIVNEGQKAKKEINGLMWNLFFAIIIVIIVLLIFLDIKAALLVAIAIPLTLSSVFGVSFLMGQNINRITLFALILSLGLLVDNATVVIENIVRHFELFKNKIKSEATIEAVNEVGPGLFMSTVTTILAFIPMAYVSGMMGPYMGPIPFFVPVAITISLIISFSINPWMASVLLSGNKTKSINLFDKINFLLKSIGAFFITRYKNILNYILESRKRQIIILISTMILLITAATFPLFKLVKFRMLPKANVNQFFLYVDLPSKSSLEETLNVTKQLEIELLKQNKHIQMIQSFVGRPPISDFNGLFKGVKNRVNFNQATMRIGLVKSEKRNITSENIVLKLRPVIYKIIKKIKTNNRPIKIKLIEDPPGPPVLSTLLVRIQGWDEKTIQKEAKYLLSKIENISGVKDVDITLPEEMVTTTLVINHIEASKTRISPEKIVATLNTLYSGKILGIYHSKDNIEQEYIRLRFSRECRKHLKVLDEIYLRNDLRISVPLSRLVKVVNGPTSKPLHRRNKVSTVYITGEMGKRSIAYASIDLLMDLYKYKLSDNKGIKTDFSLLGGTYKTIDEKIIKINIGGEWELTLEVFRDLILAMIVAIFIIYFLLIAQFQSFTDSFIIMSTIPLSIIGVMPGFMILGFVKNEYFTATSMIGIIALAGIAVNNSIILMEYLNLIRQKEKDIRKALIEVCSTRLRPIMLTTFTTILGSLTIIGDPVWAGLAYTIIFGLGMSSLLILIIFPTLYHYTKR